MTTVIKYRRPYLYPKQHDALFNECRYVWVEASTKSGKTHGCLAWITEQAALHGGPNMNWWWIAPIRETAKIAFRRLMRALPPRTFTSNLTEQSVMLPNGARIWFKGSENPDSLYGEDVYGAVVDEASRVKADSWTALRTTLTATRGPARIIGNVKGKRNWFYRGCRRAQSGLDNHHYAHIDAYDAADAGVIDKDEIEDAKLTMPESDFKELYLAEPAGDDDAFFHTERIEIVTYAPLWTPRARGWDFATTELKPGQNPDYTAGILLAHTSETTFVIDALRGRWAPDTTLDKLRACSVADRDCTDVVIEEERGAAGKVMVASIERELRQVSGTGRVHAASVTGDKSTRAFDFAVRVNGSHVALVEGDWNDAYLAELDAFPSEDMHDDQVDGSAHAYNHLAPDRRMRLSFV